MAASLAHAAGVAFAWKALRPISGDRADRADVATWTAIETETPPVDTHVSSEEPRALEPSPEVRAPVVAAPKVARLTRQVPDVAEPRSALSSESENAPWSLPTTGGVPILGALVGDGRGDAVRAGVDVTVAESQKREAARAAKQSVIARDVDLGLVPGGELVTLARDAMRRSLVPIDSHGQLRFETDATGRVTSGQVLDSSSGRAEWESLVTEVVALAQDKRLRVASGGSGVTVTMEVVSALKSAGGETQTEKRSVAATIGAVAGVIMDPLDAVASHSVPPLRVVSAHLLDVSSR